MEDREERLMTWKGAVAWGKNYDPPQGQGWYPDDMFEELRKKFPKFRSR